MAYTHDKKKEKYAIAIIVAVLLAIVAYLAWQYYTSKTPVVSGPTTTSTSPTSTSTSTPLVTLQPKSGPPSAASVIYVPDYVACSGTTCTYSVQGFGSITDIVAYGGTVTAANITYGAAYIPFNGYQLYLFGIATTTPTVNFTDTSNTIYVYANGSSGYILYKPAQAAVLLTGYTYNVSNTLYYVWVPASSDNGMTISGAQYRIYVVHGTAYVNGQPITVALGSWASPPSGILPAWAIYASQGGTYQFSLNP